MNNSIEKFGRRPNSKGSSLRTGTRRTPLPQGVIHPPFIATYASRNISPIDAAIPVASTRNIAKRFGVQYGAVHRHKTSHLAPKVARAMERREDLTAEAIVKRLEGYILEAEEGVRIAKSNGDLQGLSRLLKEARESLVYLGKTIGMWTDNKASTLIDNRVQVNALRDMSTDEIRTMVGTLRALQKPVE